MGRGDRKTAKGKRFVRSYGNSRPHKPAIADKTPAKKTPRRKAS